MDLGTPVPLPTDINSNYINHNYQTDTSNSWLKIAKYKQLIIAVKQVSSTQKTKAYTKVITSYESTGTTNLTSLNSLPSCLLFVSKKERDQGNDK